MTEEERKMFAEGLMPENWKGWNDGSYLNSGVEDKETRPKYFDATTTWPPDAPKTITFSLEGREIIKLSSENGVLDVTWPPDLQMTEAAESFLKVLKECRWLKELAVNV